MTSARFFNLSEMVLEAAGYLADDDVEATQHLQEAEALLVALGE